jgi:hypothetical protein
VEQLSLLVRERQRASIGGLELGEMLGRGSFGKVYKGARLTSTLQLSFTLKLSSTLQLSLTLQLSSTLQLLTTLSCWRASS